MNDVAIKYSEKELLTFFQKVRLEKAKELSDVNAGRKYENKEGATFGEKVSNFGKFLKRNMTSADTVKNTANTNLEKFNEANPTVLEKEVVEQELNRIFEVDKYGLAKLAFGASIILDSEYEYEYLEEGLNEASSILYGNEDTLLQIKRQLEENYRAVSINAFSNLDKAALAGAAGLAIILAPVLAIASATVGVIAAHEILIKNKEKFKDEFKKSSSETNAFYLALELTYIQRIRKSIPSDEFKEELDSILKHLEELKSDLDYYLFVERENAANNKEKVHAFNAFDKRLMKVLELE